MEFTTGRVFAIVTGLALLATVLLANSIIQVVGADEIVCIQSVTGRLNWYTTPGPKWQGFGRVTTYHKRNIYPFEQQVRFNDGAHATMVGSIQYEMPTDETHLLSIHVRFGRQSAVDEQLIKTIVDKSIYMSGPLMSAKESYAEKRTSLIWYVEDQVALGVYRTRQTETRIKDPITGSDRTVTVVEIVPNKETNLPDRQEEAVLAGFGIKPFNFVITNLKYEDTVEAQIKSQQEQTMAVQTAMAEARRAEQESLTVKAKGEASAAQAKWKQEAIKATAVTQAEQEKEVATTAAERELEVARLDRQTAEQYKSATILRAEGDAEYKRKVMEADGALQQKLATLEDIAGKYANAIAAHQGPWVPSIVMGAGAGTQTNAASTITGLVDMLTAQTARQLALDMTMKAPGR